jgi:hypothetical protein
VLVQRLALAAPCASRQDLKNIEHQHIRTMVLSDMNCTPQEFICMVHGGKYAVPGGGGEDSGTFSCKYSKL